MFPFVETRTESTMSPETLQKMNIAQFDHLASYSFRIYSKSSEQDLDKFFNDNGFEKKTAMHNKEINATMKGLMSKMVTKVTEALKTKRKNDNYLGEFLSIQDGMMLVCNKTSTLLECPLKHIQVWFIKHVSEDLFCILNKRMPQRGNLNNKEHMIACHVFKIPSSNHRHFIIFKQMLCSCYGFKELKYYNEFFNCLVLSIANHDVSCFDPDERFHKGDTEQVKNQEKLITYENDSGRYHGYGSDVNNNDINNTNNNQIRNRININTIEDYNDEARKRFPKLNNNKIDSVGASTRSLPSKLSFAFSDRKNSKCASELALQESRKNVEKKDLIDANMKNKTEGIYKGKRQLFSQASVKPQSKYKRFGSKLDSFCRRQTSVRESYLFEALTDKKKSNNKKLNNWFRSILGQNKKFTRDKLPLKKTTNVQTLSFDISFLNHPATPQYLKQDGAEMGGREGTRESSKTDYYGLEDVLNDPLATSYLHQFMRSEFSDENLAFWIKCGHYKQESNQEDRRQIAQQLYSEHIAEDSPASVNIEHHMRHALESSLDVAPLSLFDEAQKHIYHLIRDDIYPRFKKSHFYLLLDSAFPCESSPRASNDGKSGEIGRTPKIESSAKTRTHASQSPSTKSNIRPQSSYDHIRSTDTKKNDLERLALQNLSLSDDTGDGLMEILTKTHCRNEGNDLSRFVKNFINEVKDDDEDGNAVKFLLEDSNDES